MKKTLTILLVLCMIISMFTLPAFAEELQPGAAKIDGGGDIRIEEGEDAEVTYTLTYDKTTGFTTISSGMGVLNYKHEDMTFASASATHGILQIVNSETAATDDFLYTGILMVAADNLSWTYSFTDVQRTTPVSYTRFQDKLVFAFKPLVNGTGQLPTSLAFENDPTIIVQYPVTVNFDDSVTANSVFAKITEYDTGKNTYNSSGTSTTISSGDKIWVDSGEGQQNRPQLNITAPTGKIAQYKIGDQAYVDAGATLTLDAVTAATDITIRFVPVAATYTVKYKYNNGTSAEDIVDNVSVPQGQTQVSYNLKGKGIMTNGDNVFVGWTKTQTALLESNAANPAGLLLEGASFPIGQNEEVYAVWRKPAPVPDNHSTYKFVITAPTALKTGESYTTASVMLTVDQEKEVGYPDAKLKVELTKPEGSNPVITAALGNLIDLNTPLPVSENFTYNLPITKLMADKPGTYTIKLYLVHGADETVICQDSHTVVVTDATITYVLKDGKNDKNPLKANVDANVSLTPPIKTGYTFKGWSSTDVTVKNGTDPTKDPATFVMPNKNITITADYQINQYTVKFDPKNDTTIAEQKVDYGTKATKPADPTKTDYTFNGWYTAAGAKYDFNTPVTGDVTLTANYTENGTPTNPDTGDVNDAGLWIALLAVSVMSVCGSGIYGFISKKKKSEAE